MVIFQFSYLLPRTTTPTCQPEAVGQGMAIRVGSERREIRKLKYILKTKGLRFLGFGFLGSVYEAHPEAHPEAHRRSKTKALKTEPQK